MKRALYVSVTVAVVVSFTMLVNGFRGNSSQLVYIDKIELLPVVYDSAKGNDVMRAFLAPYTYQLNQTMGEVIGFASDDLDVGMPESGMSRLVADVMLAEGRKAESADVAISNIGGIRASIKRGDVTVGDVFSALPFDNALVLVALRGCTLDSLVQSIVVKGGAAVAGLTFSVNREGKPCNVMVGGVPIDNSKVYDVVTNDYLSFGNDGFDPLANYLSIKPLHVTLRDAMLGYIRCCQAKNIKIEAPEDVRVSMSN